MKNCVCQRKDSTAKQRWRCRQDNGCKIEPRKRGPVKKPVSKYTTFSASKKGKLATKRKKLRRLIRKEAPPKPQGNAQGLVKVSLCRTPTPTRSPPLEPLAKDALSFAYRQRHTVTGFVCYAGVKESTGSRMNHILTYENIQGPGDCKEWKHCPYHYYKDRDRVKQKDDKCGRSIDYSCGDSCSRQADNIHYSFKRN